MQRDSIDCIFVLSQNIGKFVCESICICGTVMFRNSHNTVRIGCIYKKNIFINYHDTFS